MKDPHTIIISPLSTEKAVNMSYGNAQTYDESEVQRSYTFIVANDSNKIEIKKAVEAIYNAGKKEKAAINVEKVRTVKVYGKSKTRGRLEGRTPDRKKAIVTLGKGQMLEDFGV